MSNLNWGSKRSSMSAGQADERGREKRTKYQEENEKTVLLSNVKTLTEAARILGFSLQQFLERLHPINDPTYEEATQLYIPSRVPGSQSTSSSGGSSSSIHTLPRVSEEITGLQPLVHDQYGQFNANTPLWDNLESNITPDASVAQFSLPEFGPSSFPISTRSQFSQSVQIDPMLSTYASDSFHSHSTFYENYSQMMMTESSACSTTPSSPPKIHENQPPDEAFQSPSENLDSWVILSKSPGRKRHRPGKEGIERFKNHARHQNYALARKLGACLRCRLYHITCKQDLSDPNGCCLTCESSPPKPGRPVCFRAKIIDAALLDHASCPRPSWTRRWKTMRIKDIEDWACNNFKTIAMTQDIDNRYYHLRVRRFSLRDGDATERIWKTNGVEQKFKCTAYAIADMREAGRELIRFADDTLESSIKYYTHGSDTLLQNTYSVAYKYSLYAEREKDRELLNSVLRLWCASRMECRSDRICGTEKLGMHSQVYDPPHENSGRILVPPVMSAQIEVIMIDLILEPLRKNILHRLQNLIEKNEKESWFAIYLCMFILLHSCALLTAGDNKKARKQGLRDRFFRPALVENLYDGATVLLAYFHGCNRGSHPFTMDWTSPRQVPWMKLDPEHAKFMNETVEEIKEKEKLFREIRESEQYENDYYFVSQLYELDWRPKPMHQ